MAEREGFEPSIRFCRILTFQASAFDHSATAPHSPGRQALVERGGWCKRRLCASLRPAPLAPSRTGGDQPARSQSATCVATSFAAWLSALPAWTASIAVTGTRASKRRFSTVWRPARVSEAS